MHRQNGSTPRRIFVVSAIGAATYSLMQSLTVPALPEIQRVLGVEQQTATWVVTVFLLTASVVTPIAGRLGDLYGKRKLLLLSLLALVLGSVVAVCAPNIWVLIAARVLQGLSGGLIPVTFGILRDCMPEEKLGKSIAVISSLISGGVAVGIVLAGPIVHWLGFRWLFVLPALLGILLIWWVPRVIPVSSTVGSDLVSIRSSVLFAAWLVILLYGISIAPQMGWLSIQVLGCGGAVVVLMLLWVRSELRVKVPLVDLRLIRSRDMLVPNLVAVLIGFSLFGAFAFIPQFLQTPLESGYGFGATVGESGVIMLPAALVSFAAGWIANDAVRRLGLRFVLVAGCVCCAIGLALLAVSHDGLVNIFIATTLNSFGSGVVFAALANAVIAAAPQQDVGVATALNANFRTLGGVVGTASVATILGVYMLPGGFPTESGYIVVFLTLSSVALLAGLVSCLVKTGGAAKD